MKNTSLDREIRSRIDSLLSDISQLVKSSALDAVHTALGVQGAAKTARSAAAPAATPRRRGRPGKRSSEDVTKTGEMFLAFVKQNEGQRLEEIGKALGVPTKELTYPVARLMEAKKLKTKGQKRGTKYYAR